jgi:transposase
VTSPATQPLPDDIETAKAMLLAERQAYRVEIRDQALLIEKLELQLFELKEEQAQAEYGATQVDGSSIQAVQAFMPLKPARRPLPEHLPRERVVILLPLPARAAAAGRTSGARM